MLIKTKCQIEILKELPNQFTAKQIIDIAVNYGLSESAAKNRLVPRLLKKQKIYKPKHGIYCKAGVDFVDNHSVEDKLEDLAQKIFAKSYNDLLPIQQTPLIEQL